MAPESPSGGGTGSSGFDISSINRNDLGVMIAGAAALIASFFPFAGLDLGIAHYSQSAWSSYGVLAVLLLLLGAGVIALKTFAAGSLPSNLPVGLHVAAAGLAGLGTVLILIRAFTASKSGIDLDTKWGAYVMIVVGVAEVVFAVLGMRESGEEIPGMNRGTAAPPAPPAG
jgi:hypothetical protein